MQDLLDAVGSLDVVAVVDFDPVEIDAAAKLGAQAVRVEADVGEVADAFR